MVKSNTSATPVDVAPVDASTKKRSSKKESAPVKSEPVVVEQPPVVTDAPAEKGDVSSELLEEVADLLKNIQSRTALDNLIKTNAKAIEKKVQRMSKLMDKSVKKRKTSQNKVSGFEKPTAISDELAKFVSEPAGSMLARTAVSKKIHEYVKENNLQNPENRRIINPDAKLKKLLKIGAGEELSYFNLQKFLKVHFKKA
jgi:chromatin remodeling complex protein RSC6